MNITDFAAHSNDMDIYIDTATAGKRPLILHGWLQVAPKTPFTDDQIEAICGDLRVLSLNPEERTITLTWGDE